METEILKEAGLTEGEIKVYLALLEIGSSTTGPIIDNSGIARSFIYQILEKLMQKGLVSYVTKEKTKYYQAADPAKILDYIDERKKSLEENKRKVENLLPELMLKQKSSKDSDVRVFEGFKGMVTAHENTYNVLSEGDEYYGLVTAIEQPEYFHSYWKKDHIRRAKAKIKCKLMFNPDTPRNVMENRNSYEGCDARYMGEITESPSWFNVHKDYVMIGLVSKNPISILIKNQEIANSFKAYFDSFWKKTKKFS
ncbi:hypothetical protein BVX95_02290 [archaeon D22]|nr:hypothetical protein BVX95_02290 [archaeon D22]